MHHRYIYIFCIWIMYATSFQCCFDCLTLTHISSNVVLTQSIVLKMLLFSYGYKLSELTHFAPHKHCNSLYLWLWCSQSKMNDIKLTFLPKFNPTAQIINYYYKLTIVNQVKASRHKAILNTVFLYFLSNWFCSFLNPKIFCTAALMIPLQTYTNMLLNIYNIYLKFTQKTHTHKKNKTPLEHKGEWLFCSLDTVGWLMQIILCHLNIIRWIYLPAQV